MCVRIRLPLSRMKNGLLQAALAASFTTVSQPQVLLAVVAEPSETASRLIAGVEGSPRWRNKISLGVPEASTL